MHADYLIEFITVAEEGSLSRAATKITQSQPCLSRHMRALEEELGLKLLERHSAGMRLTEAGSFVLGKAREMKATLEEVEHYARSRQDMDALSIAGLYRMGGLARRVQDCCRGFTLDGDDVIVELQPNDVIKDRSLSDALDEGLVDIVFLLANDPRLATLPSQYPRKLMAHCHLMALMEPGNALAEKEDLSARDINGRLFLHDEQGMEFEEENWADTKKMLATMGLSYREKEIPYFEGQDPLPDLKNGILLVPEGHDALEAFGEAGKVALPVHEQFKTFFAACRPDDRRAQAVLAHLAEALE